jgi:hypothetical protein
MIWNQMDILAFSEEVDVTKWHFAKVMVIADACILVFFAAKTTNPPGILTRQSESSDACE